MLEQRTLMEYFEKTMVSKSQCIELFESLPLLDNFIAFASKKLAKKPLENTAIVYIHHPLKTSINVVESMLALGALPSNIYVLGKKYSENIEVVSALEKVGVHYQRCSTQSRIGGYSAAFIKDIHALWSLFTRTVGSDIKQVIVLDHGGHAISQMPVDLKDQYRMIGVEKTTAGFIGKEKNFNTPIPLLDVANSATKKFLESPLIAGAVVRKALKYLPADNKRHVCGVVGLGAIGKALSQKLLTMGCQVMVYDVNTSRLPNAIGGEKIEVAKNLSELIQGSDYIFGCSGVDISKSDLDSFTKSVKNKTLISCSSEDKEYLTLLNYLHEKGYDATNPFEDISYLTESLATINIVKGGFPVNFDNTGISVPAEEIQLTRTLVVSAIIQAIELFQLPDLENRVYVLSPESQQYIVENWLRGNTSYNTRVLMDISYFQSRTWIEKNSVYG